MREKADVKKRLAVRLREMREYLGLSQDEVAKLTQIPLSTLLSIEKAEREVDVQELERFGEIYRCSVDALTGDATETAAIQRKIQFLANAASKLSAQDREELLRFARFVNAKNKDIEK